MAYSSDNNGYVLGMDFNYGWARIYVEDLQGAKTANNVTYNQGYIKNTELFMCPSVDSGSWSTWKEYGSGAAYGNCVPEKARITIGSTKWVFLNKLQKPSIATGLADSIRDDYKNQTPSVNLGSAFFNFVGHVCLRHNNRCCTWFFDGHAATVGFDELAENTRDVTSDSFSFYIYAVSDKNIILSKLIIP